LILIELAAATTGFTPACLLTTRKCLKSNPTIMCTSWLIAMIYLITSMKNKQVKDRARNEAKLNNSLLQFIKTNPATVDGRFCSANFMLTRPLMPPKQIRQNKKACCSNPINI